MSLDYPFPPKGFQRLHLYWGQTYIVTLNKKYLSSLVLDYYRRSDKAVFVYVVCLSWAGQIFLLKTIFSRMKMPLENSDFSLKCQASKPRSIFIWEIKDISIINVNLASHRNCSLSPSLWSKKKSFPGYAIVKNYCDRIQNNTHHRAQIQKINLGRGRQRALICSLEICMSKK